MLYFGNCLYFGKTIKKTDLINLYYSLSRELNTDFVSRCRKLSTDGGAGHVVQLPAMKSGEILTAQ